MTTCCGYIDIGSTEPLTEEILVGKKQKLMPKWSVEATAGSVFAVLSLLVAGTCRWMATTDELQAVFCNTMARDTILGPLSKASDLHDAAEATLDAHYETIMMWIFVVIAVVLLLATVKSVLRAARN